MSRDWQKKLNRLSRDEATPPPPAKAADDDSPLDLSAMPSMAELLGETSPYRRSRPRSGPTSAPASDAPSPLATENLPDMGELLAEQDAAESARRPAPAPAPRRARAPAPAPEVLDLTNMPSMDELVAAGSAALPLTVTVHTRQPDGVTVQLDAGREGFVPREEFAVWEVVHPGDRLLVVIVGDEPGGRALLRLEKVLATRRHEKGTARAEAEPTVLAGTRFVVDGSNVCRGYHEQHGVSSLAPLLTLVLALYRERATCRCFFDANERYVLRQNRAEPYGEALYEKLLHDHPGTFVEVAGATSADETLLRYADRERLRVITNDRFAKLDEQYRRQYPWLQTGSRLVRGSLEHDRLRLPSLGLDVSLRHDLARLAEELASLL